MAKPQSVVDVDFGWRRTRDGRRLLRAHRTRGPVEGDLVTVTDGVDTRSGRIVHIDATTFWIDDEQAS